MTAALVSAHGLTKHYRVAGRRRLTAVNDVDLEVAAGTVRAVVGESGCGKSTTGRLLLGLETPSAGEVRFDGRGLAERSPAELRALRRELQVVFQDPYDVLNPRMRVDTILREPARVHGQEGSARSVPDLLDLVNLSSDFAERYPHELSGGQRQRIAIARAIALNPRFVVCDEPVSALDVSVQAQVVNLLRRLQDDLGLAYLFISHDLALVRYLAQDTTVMYLGRVVEEGPTEQLFADPRHPYTQLLLAAVPRVRGERSATSREVRRLGELPSPLDAPPGCVFATRCPLADDRCRATRPELRDVNGHRVACHYAETADVAA
ncbi:peptide/nickel transport system ATP-binding protein/oligopeptide transport system ATP-binding protein/dipeptide transport system ATP-binding protein [Jatrophihabitans endophyticus]|uniref:Peptide/nickel transport system ATP-binding protein/oligopeptide transport system ATP-binding protein/dipeptide transport system ATP-binding protein n=1 Tax=Jatrophihabitans endophyticus TaxID=1206085 RepID=A0A1M5S176_9ACTN|nr:oligopeptide/dipeptide ABC transporter ATP-binding protein [Jatrophihabitans endophyticus]SHH32402.1 peptide/nickel transport system ATP-binding protein/oligopeptide transport system ATP-binding protein/dipeptide transport system ATP-binding protein [Jatrophihabitans endophyticus]